MARFDVYRAPDGGYWLDCQSNLLSALSSRFVVPLLPRDAIPGGDRRLNPIFSIDGGEYVMQTHFAATVPAALLRDRIADPGEHEYAIGGALDMVAGRY